MNNVIERNKALLSDLAALIGLSIDGADISIDTLNLANRHTDYNSMLSYTTSVEFCENILNNSCVKALFVNTSDVVSIKEYFLSHNRTLSYIVAENAEYAFYDLHNLLWKKTTFYDKYEWPSVIGESCTIAPSAIIEDGVIIGNNVTIGYNTVVCRGTIIEDDVFIGCNSTIGVDGFQAIQGYKGIVKHIGRTIIHKGAEIRDNTTICNSLFEGNTEVGAYSKIDSHVQFAHNCKCGEYCVICASATIFGSVTIGDRVWVAPNSAVLNKVLIEDDAFIGAMSYVNRKVKKGTTVFGVPIKKML